MWMHHMVHCLGYNYVCIFIRDWSDIMTGEKERTGQIWPHSLAIGQVWIFLLKFENKIYTKIWIIWCVLVLIMTFKYIESESWISSMAPIWKNTIPWFTIYRIPLKSPLIFQYEGGDVQLMITTFTLTHNLDPTSAVSVRHNEKLAQ